MARTRTSFKLPFLKFKINKKTIFNIFGFLIIGFSLVLLASFWKQLANTTDGRLLPQINQFLIDKFGGLSILIPFILIFLSGHFFSSKKLKLIKPNMTIGIIMIFIALLGVLKSGSFGNEIFTNLTLDFSLFGGIIILIIAFMIGLILFLDTSIDAFLLLVIHVLTGLFNLIKSSISRPGLEKKHETREGLQKERFIKDTKVAQKPQVHPLPMTSVPTLKQTPDILIKPISKQSQNTWIYPPMTILQNVHQKEADRGDVKHNADVIEKTLDSFAIRARVAEVNFGPTVTQYALEITMGTKLSKITALGNDLALALAAPTGQVRIEAPIPGRSLVGIEIPNKKPELVTLRRLFSSPVFANNNDPLLVPLGLDVSGNAQATCISKMPHVLIAGTTGSGKSVLLNSWICTFLFRAKPEDLRLILVDPKRVELTLYNGIPHLLTEVIVEPEKIISALKWTVSEMENRYKEFAKVGARNIEGYNNIENIEKKPFIIFVIDELADLMIFAPGDAEDLITRIAQMARATGIHLLLATQRPSVDVITGLMKANIPARVAFNVSSMIDSRVIIDMPGAEKLLGKGDMLFLPPDQAKPRRIQSPHITEKEVQELVKFLKAQSPEVHYTEEVTEQDLVFVKDKRGGTMIATEDKDPYFEKAIEIIMQHDKASASLLQRRLSVGYARAARLLDQLQEAGYVGPAEGSKPRDVIKRRAGEEPLGTQVE